MKTKAILESNAMQENEIAANGGDIDNTGIPAGLQKQQGQQGNGQSEQKLLNDAFDEGYDEAMLDADLAAEQKTSEDPFGPETKHTIKFDEEAERDNVDLPEQQESYIDQLAKYYRVMAQEFKLRFHDKPEDGEKLAQFLVTKILSKPNSTNAQKWIDYINKRAQNGKSKSIIQMKIIPTLAKAANIEVPRQVNNEQTEYIANRNGNFVGSIVVPEGFNQPPIDLGNTAISFEFGYPAINYKSKLITEITGETEQNRLKKLLIALIEQINGTPAAKTFLTRGVFQSWTGKKARSTLNRVIKEAAHAMGVPMIRRPLKVTAQALVGDSEAEEISCIPINQTANKKAIVRESIDANDTNALLEGPISFLKNRFKADSTSAQMFGKPVTLNRNYLCQFYTVLAPSGTAGLTKYARFMDQDDYDNIVKKLGEKSMQEIKDANSNVNDRLFIDYLNKTSGVPPFYILIPRKNERIRVCDENMVNGNVCVKSIDSKNKEAYFFPQENVKSVFEAG